MENLLNIEYTQSAVLREILDSLYDGVYCTDTERRIIYWNEAAEKLTGFNKKEVLGQKCSDNILRHITEEGCELCCASCPLYATMQDGKSRETMLYLHHKNGHRLPVCIRTSPLTDAAGSVTGGVEIFSNAAMVMSLRLANERLRKLAFFDELTQLPNRRYGVQKLEEAQYDLKRYGHNFGVIIFDVDKFKAINDNYGHDTGDKVLRMVGQSLQMGARETDFVCRWGGEEFICVITEATQETICTVAERQRLLVEHSFLDRSNNQDGVVNVTISGGATICQPDQTLEALVNEADAALYQSKNGGRNRVTLFSGNRSS